MSKNLITLIALFLFVGVIAPGAMAFSKNSLTMEKCTDCHAVKDGKISRIEEIRATPDEWGVIIDRMARLYGMELDEDERDILLQEICETQILSPEELEKAKTRARANLIRQLASNQGLAAQLAFYEVISGDWRNLFKQLDKIDQVRAEDIQRVAEKYFTTKNRTVGVIETASTKI